MQLKQSAVWGAMVVLLFAVFGEAQEMSGSLTQKQRQIAVIAANTAVGNMARLAPELNAGLDAGLTVNEIKEVLIQMYAYAGFPRCLNGISALMTVLEERAAKGVQDEIGAESDAMPAGKTSVEVGAEIQTALIGAPASGKIYEFAPAVDQFLKGHLFGDIFARGLLTNADREIATIAALAALTGAEAQLKGHLGIGLNIGLTAAQLRDLQTVVATKIDRQAGERLKNILDEIAPASDASGATEAQPVFRKGESYPGPVECFTGEVKITPVFMPNETARYGAGYVTFAAGARSAWHTHPAGQHLIVVAGTAWTQEWNGKKSVANIGDAVWCPVGVKHWHGATPDGEMTHLALTGVDANGKNVVWLEKVSDEQYREE